MLVMRAALVCDFCHPNLGGIESHLLKLSSELRKRSHHVVAVDMAVVECRLMESTRS